MNTEITILSSNGEAGSSIGFVIDERGKIIERRGDFTTDSEATIVRFDVVEYSTTYGEPDSVIDILNIGYWYTDSSGNESYEPPEEDFRKDVAEHLSS